MWSQPVDGFQMGDLFIFLSSQRSTEKERGRERAVVTGTPIWTAAADSKSILHEECARTAQEITHYMRTYESFRRLLARKTETKEIILHCCM